MPVISVVIPCYNHGKFLDDAIDSIPKDFNGNIEIIVVNDGSTDDFTIEKLKEVKKRGITVVNQENKGLSAARNYGIKSSNSKYFIPLDSDNKITTALITKAIYILETNPNVGVVYSDFFFFGEKTGIKHQPQFNIRDMLRANHIDACAVIRKETWKTVGGYDENMKLGYEDWEFWLAVFKSNYHFYHLKEPLFYYRSRSDSMVSISGTEENHKKIRSYIHKKYWDFLSAEFLKITTEERSIKLLIRKIYTNCKKRIL